MIQLLLQLDDEPFVVDKWVYEPFVVDKWVYGPIVAGKWTHEPFVITIRYMSHLLF